MIWPGTLCGIGIGLAVASIPGALLGALLGQVVDRRLRLASWADLYARLRGGASLPLEELVFVLLGRLAKSDGRVTQRHIEQARQEMRRMRLEEGQQKRAIEAFGRGRDIDPGLREPLRALRAEPAKVEVVLSACWRMAWVDDQVSTRERELILLWGKWLGWDVNAIEALGRRLGPSPSHTQVRPMASSAYQQALRLLGVSAESAPAEIKRAYRRLISRHHPDKLAGAGAGPDEIRKATERTRALQQAYDLIRDRHGFR